MGTWGPGSFSNDAALDWLADLIEGEPKLLDLALDNALGAAALTDPVCTAALVAAELVAAALGLGDERLNEAAATWLDMHRDSVRLLGPVKARRAVQRVYEDSELRELWDEAGRPEWHADVRELLSRLGR